MIHDYRTIKNYIILQIIIRFKDTNIIRAVLVEFEMIVTNSDVVSAERGIVCKSYLPKNAVPISDNNTNGSN